MDNELFLLADKLKALREEKDHFKIMLSDIEKDISAAEWKLTEAMAEAECSNFTRGNKQFILVTTSRWSVAEGRKEDLYAVLKEQGYEELFTVNSQTLASFIKEQVAETADNNGDTHVPDWLVGLVRNYDQTGITMKAATKKSK
jgi:hypothetical protein